MVSKQDTQIHGWEMCVLSAAVMPMLWIQIILTLFTVQRSKLKDRIEG